MVTSTGATEGAIAIGTPKPAIAICSARMSRVVRAVCIVSAIIVCAA